MNNLKEKNERIEIFFDEGLFGLEHLKKFIILSPREDIPFKYLQSVEDESISLIVTDPYIFYPDYTVDLYEDVINELDITDDNDVLVLIVAVIPKDFTKMTANFVAPILINAKNKKGKQIIIEGNKYKVRENIFEIYKSKAEQEV